MSAMIVAPAVAARQWTNKLNLMVILAAGFGAFAGVSGTIVSSSVTDIPTGPMIILCAAFFVGISIAFAPKRGLIWNRIRQRKNKRSLKLATSRLLEYPQQESE